MKDSASFTITHLIKTYDEELRRVIFRRCGCIDMAADIVQETYQRMLSGGLWQQADNPRALLHRIAANLATDYQRRDAVRDKYVDQTDTLPDWIAEADNTQPDRILANREHLERLAVIVNQLPPKCRTVFLMRKIDELSHAEIAERLGISRNMVEKHLRNALLALQKIDE
ncbi:RNA polymerase sigma factor [Methylomonas rivi]|uniref:RNA polymerase sigma factor n=1 Tax=Methylomonas rivi TaxID=2952226 RepID=A0ABT1U0E2_9GAMM|nr:RNA polymerase sigma factor [Methylomonas sp. WSC-6]MCQ8127106.1 RNA polymerase sigma factor [Methylomonas sp. WSC-6]